ncbi:MAG: hypothetical protein MIO92_09325 [Methanosarcinaceae archaeon]|nr:hypothetical protein [Methanosarcinaceae archaeon]
MMKQLTTVRRKMPKSGKVRMDAEFSNYIGQKHLFNKVFVGKLFAYGMWAFEFGKERGHEFHADSMLKVLIQQLDIKKEYDKIYAEINKDLAEVSKNNAVPELPDKVKYMYEIINQFEKGVKHDRDT